MDFPWTFLDWHTVSPVISVGPRLDFDILDFRPQAVDQSRKGNLARGYLPFGESPELLLTPSIGIITIRNQGW
jgi:hypothetical protein